MSEDQKASEANAPAPEVLEVQHDSSESVEEKTDQKAGDNSKPATPLRRRVAYRPSHKATFIGLAVVAVILAVNAIIISLVMKNQADAQDAAVKNGVTISGDVLDKLGVSRNPVGNAETQLTVGPNAVFNGKVTMAGDTTIGGQLTLNSKFSAGDASLAKLQAGDTQVQQLNVNGDGTVTNLNIRKDLQVAGLTRIQGQLTVNQLTTINNNLNVAGSLAIGGSLSVRNFQVSTLTVTGHLLSSGSAPGVSGGGAVGSNGTVSISGNDTSGTVAVNTGTGAGNGLLASVSFREKYGNTPHVVVTPIGRSVPGLYINRTSSGFSISVDGAMAPGGYAFDYVIVQ
jgi:hypothetical protein